MTDIKSVTAKTLKDWLDKGEAVVIDVREASEYDEGHIKNSTLIPLSSINKSVLPKVKPNQKYVIHCKLGKRGNSACEKLLQEDPSLELYNLEGGISAWESAGFPIEKLSNCKLSLERQAQITSGGGVFLGTFLGLIIHPIFFLVPLALGLGLVITGLTGVCKLTAILADMPWNKK